MAVPRREFLGWDKPVLELVVERLLSEAPGGSPIDLSRVLVVVPTRNAGRRLREALALAVTGRGGALIPPRVVPPEYFLTGGRAAVAGPAATAFVWADVLAKADLEHLRALFPVDPAERGFGWAVQMGATVERARAVLGECGMRVGDLVKEEVAERGRWENMASLESKFVRALERCGLADGQTSRIAGALGHTLPDGVCRVVLAATPDPVPLALFALERHAGSLPVDVWVHAPESLADAFDIWGRPDPDFWRRREIPFPDGEETVEVVAKPASQAVAVVSFLQEHGDHPVAVGVAGPELVPFLSEALEDAGVPTFDPEGTPFRKHPLYHLLATFARLLKEPRFRTFGELLRCPDFLAALRDRGKNFRSVHMLEAFDALDARHLPATLEDAKSALERSDQERHPPLPEQGFAIGEVEKLLGLFADNDFAEAVGSLCGYIYGHRAFGSHTLEGRTFTEVASAITGLAGELGGVADKASRAADRLEILVDMLGNGRIYGEREGAELDLQGWLELPWEDALDLVVAGFNDGAVPEAVVGDPFLPESAREKLGLRTNDQRFARDAYLLSAMLAWRAEVGGSVRLVCGKTAANGAPLKPSRLLFRCSDTVLPDRVLRLFHEGQRTGAGDGPPPWELGWRLSPPAGQGAVPVPECLPVTAFSAFLDCPFRFYLSRVLGMRETNPEKSEMDALDFGNLCHVALERFGRDPQVRDSDSSKKIGAFLVAAAYDYVTLRYGVNPPVPVRLQLEAAKKRLFRLAEYQAVERAAGWKIDDAERVFGDGGDWCIGGMPVVGKIDRVERHEDGRVRVLDYKTSTRATDPAGGHLVKPGRGGETGAAWKFFEPAGSKPQRWTNLQLPLYCLWARDHIDGARGGLECGYFNLPKAAEGTGVAVWQGGADDALLESARQCVEAVVERVRAGAFWPPARKVDYDDFGTLSFGTLEESVDVEAFEEFFGKGGGR